MSTFFVAQKNHFFLEILKFSIFEIEKIEKNEIQNFDFFDFLYDFPMIFQITFSGFFENFENFDFSKKFDVSLTFAIFIFFSRG